MTKTAGIKTVALGISHIGLLAGPMSAPVFAQQAPPNAPDAQAALRIAERTLRRRAVPRVAATISAQATAKILVTAPLLEQRVTPPETVATSANLETDLTDLVHRLPDATWAKIYLPILPDGRGYRADAVALLVQAQADVYRAPDKPVNDKTPPKTVLLQGRWLTDEEAKPLIKTLQLEPIYVLMSRSATTLTLAQQSQGGSFIHAERGKVLSFSIQSDSNSPITILAVPQDPTPAPPPPEN